MTSASVFRTCLQLAIPLTAMIYRCYWYLVILYFYYFQENFNVFCILYFARHSQSNYWKKVFELRGDTICLRPLQVDNIFVLFRQVAPVPACWLFKTSATSWPLTSTLIVVSESRVTWATSVPILAFLGLSVLELDPMYAIDRETHVRRQTDVRQKHRLMPPPGGGIKRYFCLTSVCSPPYGDQGIITRILAN